MRNAYIAATLGLILILTACGDDSDTGSGNNTADISGDVASTPTDGSSASDPGPGTGCLPDCNGLLADNPERLCQVYSGAYTSGTVSCSVDCQVDVSQCLTDTPAPTPSPEFGPCDGATQCEAGFECLGAAPGGEGICGTPCAGEDDTSCGPGRECLGLNTGGGICFNNDAQRDQPCLMNGSTCAEGQGECVAVTFDEVGNPTDTRCKVLCDGPGIGAQATCSAGETCLANPVGFLTLQEGADGAGVPCTTPGEQDVCAADFECFQTGGGQTVCAQRVGWCGDLVPVCGDVTQADQCGVCGAPDGHAYCSIVGAVGEPALAECFIPPNSVAGICLGYCETDGDPDLDCGTGYTCVMPPLDQAVYVVPQGGEQQVPCTDDSVCDTANGFTCVELSAGSTVCARPLKMCLTTP